MDITIKKQYRKNKIIIDFKMIKKNSIIMIKKLINQKKRRQDQNKIYKS